VGDAFDWRLSLRRDPLRSQRRHDGARALPLRGLPPPLRGTDGRLGDVFAQSRQSRARQPKIYQSSEHGRRHFCADCGTGLFYINENLMPDIIDVQSGTYDDPDAVPATMHIQVAERIGWMERAHELPVFERFPPLE
jgi:hypothetical protein